MCGLPFFSKISWILDEVQAGLVISSRVGWVGWKVQYEARGGRDGTARDGTGEGGQGRLTWTCFLARLRWIRSGSDSPVSIVYFEERVPVADWKG